VKRNSLPLHAKASVSLSSLLGRGAQRLGHSPAACVGTDFEAGERVALLVEAADARRLAQRLSDRDQDLDTVVLSERFLSVSAGPATVRALIEDADVGRIQTKKAKAVRLEKALPDVGLAPAPAVRPVSEDGTGVLIGIVDTGFDLSHPMFRDGTGALRVQALLDQTANDLEYNTNQLEVGWRSGGAKPGHDPEGHGTHVASIAAGSRFVLGEGVAPGARLLLVKTDFRNTDKAVQWVFARATNRQQPCVVNMSLGHHLGSHDGTDAEERLLSALTGPGRIVVASAGNERDDAIHIGGRFYVGQNQNAGFEVLRQHRDRPNATLSLWYCEGDAFDLVLVSPGGDELPVPIGQQADVYESAQVDVELARKRYVWSHLQQVQIALGFKSEHVSDRLLRGWELRITCRAATVGRIDGWFHNSGFARFGAGSLIETGRTIGLPATSEGCLAVASHVTRTKWDADLGSQHDARLVSGRISPFSSLGPTRDGRWKPELSAPGQYVTAALAERSQMAKFDDRALKDERLLTMEGTSMSAPVVTGVVALLLQRRPTLTVEDVRTLLRETARKDAHTGSAPWDPAYGFGKLDAARVIAALSTP
jgi:subtilisin family serine protease